MKKSKFTGEQIAFVLRQAEVGTPIAEGVGRCLNTHWFLSLDDARSKIEAWRTAFNETRPHTSLGFMTPAEFASSAGVNPGR